jgi:predicted metal-dependent HD superfamily phosphohydrolase
MLAATMLTTTDAGAARFAEVWERCVASPPSPSAKDVYGELRDRLGGNDRRFHNLGHIDECLRHLDRVAALVRDRDAVELALWFHDAEYSPGDATNERRSAELFVRLAPGASALLRRRVVGLILATRHRFPARTLDRRYIEDIDLIGFGAPWDKFMHNGDLLRNEFSSQSDQQYYAGQVAFLAMLERRPVFFLTDYFRTRYEAKAQENIRRLLALRASEGYVPTPSA